MDSRSPSPLRLVAANFHVLAPCNAQCRFCFATFRDVPGQLSVAAACAVVEALAAAGCEKLTFAGGEPTLYRELGTLLRRAKSSGMVTCVVTNGFRLPALLERHAGSVDWVGLSVDSSDEAVQHALGRGPGDHVREAIRLADLCRDVGVRLKLNTVVTSLTWEEDMADLVRHVRPERWKVFQVLPIEGQNDGDVDDLLIEPDQFDAFVQRHRRLDAEGLAPVVEDNDAMRGSYVMVDPLGRFFGNASGRHVYSEPILEVGVDVALGQVGFQPEKLVARGGVYDW